MERKKTKDKDFPPGWDEQLVLKVIDHYERQTEDETIAEDESTYEKESGEYEEESRA